MTTDRATGTKPEDVRAWLVGLFLSLPNAPVYAATRREVEFIDPNLSPSAFDWPALASEVLGARSHERLWLLTAARCEARRIALARGLPNPPAGGSVREFCIEYGIYRATFERSVRRSLERLAREWDRRREVLKQAHTEGSDRPGNVTPDLRTGAVRGSSVPDPGLGIAYKSRPPVSTTQS